MTGDLLKCNVLATHTIANVSEHWHFYAIV